MLALLGGGKMGEALARGWLGAGIDPEGIGVVEVVESRRAYLREVLQGVRVVGDVGELAPLDGAVLAVKPADVGEAARSAVSAGASRVLSIAAGVRLAVLEEAAPGAAVIRAMPNTPALVGAGMSAFALGSSCGPDDEKWASELLGAVGDVVVTTEGSLDAVTAVSGSGPAYIFLVAEALIEAAVLEGLPRQVASTLVSQTIRGAGEMLLTLDTSPAQLRADVTSPAGTTAAGLRQLERNGVRAAFIEAVRAATARSAEMGH